jgi:hypothetical protein
MHLEAGFLTGFRQRLELILPVHFIQINILPPVAPAHDVVNGTTLFNSQLARHGRRDARIPSFRQSKTNQTMG